ncbi:UNVERIFIED_CONTAM: hypothetical protein Slati_4505700 [Sesamum latifolium]|uniref:Reverse transcriptase/retrotransposon-derived protein RNase H-like domain-containing protein n=1 Tax=Sesamum latifolium TaxID=2727402 RepID=A0AAW2SSE9_9LAMI
MKPPTNLNEVQRLAGGIAALSRFISRSAEPSLPFFKALRKAKDFVWDEECQQAFQDLKMYLARLPLLTKSIPGETLYLYLAADQQAVSSVLIKEEERLQKPIYYITQVSNQDASFGRIHKGNNIYGRDESSWLFHIDGSSTLTGSGAGVVETDWRKPLLEYLERSILPADEKEASRLKNRQPIKPYEWDTSGRPSRMMRSAGPEDVTIPTACPTYSRSSRAPKNNVGPLSLLPMGNGHSRCLPDGNGVTGERFKIGVLSKASNSVSHPSPIPKLTRKLKSSI